MRRLTLFAGAVVFLDTMFLAAVAPLLPYYEQHLGISKAAAGALTASYAVGALVAALPAGWFAARAGVKPAVSIGLAMIGAASLAFGFGKSLHVLEAARFLQGIGGALAWAGALSWLIRTAPAERRGEMVGSALSAAILGALLGPALGALAAAAGPGPVFAGVAALAGALVAWLYAMPHAPPVEPGSARALLDAIRHPRSATAIWLTVLAAMSFGVISVLGPLRLHRLGAGETAIGAVFVAGAALSAIASPLVGRASDRHGRMTPIRMGLVASAMLAALLPWPGTLALFIPILLACEPAFGVPYVPAGAILSEEAEKHGVDQAIAFGLFNLAWAVGDIAGAAFGARLAETFSDTLVYLGLAAMAAGTLVVLSGGSAAPRFSTRRYDPAP